MTKLSTNNGLTMLYFLKKLRKNICRYHYFTPVYQKSWWYDLQFLRYRVWQTEIGNYGSFFDLLLLLLKTWKIRILKKNEKYCWRYHHSTHVYQKPQLYEVQFLRYWVRQNFLSFWARFCPFTPLTTHKIKILKKWKSIWRGHHFTHVHQKSRSYDVCFMRYGAQQT